MIQFRILKNKDVIQGISDISFGSMINDENVVRFFNFLGYKNIISQEIVWAEQVFGSMVHICREQDSGKVIKNVDGLISNIPGQIIANVFADCLPILLYDPKKEVVGVLHGARTSLIKGIIKKAIKKMVFNFGSNPQDILVGIGPHIRKCHYWLRKEIYHNFKNAKFKKYLISKNRKIFFDLTKLTFDELLSSGIKRKNIEDCQVCTFCQFKKYFSARKKEKSPKIYSKKSPRFASFISLKAPEVLRVLGRAPNSLIKKAIESIREGKILVCPTDTVYGLIADAANKKAVEKLFKIKKRNLRKPVPIFVKDLKMAKNLAEIDKEKERILTSHQNKFGAGREKFWPGKITIVLKRKKSKIKIYGVEKKTIALRIPNYRFLNILLKKINRPLTGTSANISGEKASTEIREVISQFKNQKNLPDLILDAGDLKKSLPSTVIDLTKKTPKILREGQKIPQLYGK